MSELSDRLAKLERGGVSEPCPLGKIIQSLDPITAGILEKTLAGRAPTRAIHHELTNSGFKIGRDTVASHRNGWCRCSKVEAQ